MASSSWRRVALVTAASRAVIVLSAVLADLAVPDYDTSSDLVYDGPLKALVRWDAVHMLAIARNGGHMYEQQYAFFPLLPLATHALAQLFGGGDAAHAVVGILLANACFVGAAVALYALGRRELRDERLAMGGALLFNVTPGAVFIASIYSEAPFALLVFTGLLLRSMRRPLAAAILFGLATLARANGIVFAGFFLYDLLLRLRDGAPVRWLLVDAPKTAALVALSASGFLAYQARAYHTFCVAGDAEESERRPWCFATVPLIYDFVQREYWNVGLFRYFEAKQLPNFAIAAPVLGFCLLAIWRYAAFDWRRALTAGLSVGRRAGKADSGIEANSGLLPHYVLLLYMVLLTAFVAHIQIVNRLFSCMPIMYWAAADGLARGRREARALVTFFVGYAAAVTVLFANFYPPA